MMRNLEWTMGAPEKLEPGMLVQLKSRQALLIGHLDDSAHMDNPCSGEVMKFAIRWAWVIKPHELEWAADMAGKHAKGRPEQ